MDDVVFEGQLAGFTFAEVLQLAASKRERLRVEVFDDRQRFGAVYLDGALVLGARVDALSGISALAVLLRLSEGRVLVVRDRVERPATLNRSLDGALLECADLDDSLTSDSRPTLLSEPPGDH